MKKSILLGLLLAFSSASFADCGGCNTGYRSGCCATTVRYVQPAPRCCTYVKRTYCRPVCCTKTYVVRPRCGCGSFGGGY